MTPGARLHAAIELLTAISVDTAPAAAGTDRFFCAVPERRA